MTVEAGKRPIRESSLAKTGMKSSGKKVSEGDDAANSTIFRDLKEGHSRSRIPSLIIVSYFIFLFEVLLLREGKILQRIKPGRYPSEA